MGREVRFLKVAPGPAPPLRYVTICEHYYIVPEIATLIFPFAYRKSSTAAPMLQLVIDQPRQRRLLPPVPLGLLFPGQSAQPREVLAAGAQLKQLEFESLMFDAG